MATEDELPTAQYFGFLDGTKVKLSTIFSIGFVIEGQEPTTEEGTFNGELDTGSIFTVGKSRVQVRNTYKVPQGGLLIYGMDENIYLLELVSPIGWPSTDKRKRALI